MFIPQSYSLAVILCIITMICWGSWGNTQKLAGKTWRFELFYWDYVIGNSFTGLLHLALATDLTLIEGYYPSSVYGTDLTKHVRSTMNFVNNIPITYRPKLLVIQNYASGSANDQLDVYGVLFDSVTYNFYVDLLCYDRESDIDIEKMEVSSAGVFSSASDMAISLRWIAILANRLECDLAASTGIHDGKGVIKQLLAGAQVVQLASVLYQQGPEFIRVMLDELQSWMERKNFSDIAAFRGKLSQSMSSIFPNEVLACGNRVR